MLTEATVRPHNFSAGPSILPREVIEKAADALRDFAGTGLSLIEVSHRGKEFEAAMANARALVKELLGVPDGYDVLFLQGGASLGFHMVPMNLMRPGGKTAYLKTGEWAMRAVKDAQLIGETVVVASSEDKNYSYIPKQYTIPADAEYFHYTSNNTIFGTQLHRTPNSPVPLVCDMSSDIFSRPVNVADFTLIYAGAQKNMGPAGTTLYIVKRDALGRTGRKLSPILDLKNHAEKESMYNTPPVFAVYVSMLTLEWLKGIGGIAAMQQRNEAKAKLLYDAIDTLPVFKGTAANEDRSLMNVCFVMNDPALEPEFDKLWKSAGISGIRGHRSVGGYRASLYNALPIESVQVLVDVMTEFANKKG